MRKEQTKKEKTVAEYRLDLLLTQIKLSEVSGLSLNTIKKCEAGNRWPERGITRRRYFKGLGLTRSKINAIEYSIASNGN